MSEPDVSIEDKFALLQHLFAPTKSGDKNAHKPVILALKPFDPDKVLNILVIDALRGKIDVTIGEETVGKIGAHAVNFLTDKAGWQIAAMILMNRADNYHQTTVQELLVVLILPKKEKVSK